MDQRGIGGNFLKLDIGAGRKQYILHGPNMRRKQGLRINWNNTLSDFNTTTGHQSISSGIITAKRDFYQETAPQIVE